MTPGTFCYNELHTSDVAGGQTFYAELFGWTPATSGLSTEDGGTYTIFKSGDSDVAGMLLLSAEETAQGAPPHWLSYVAVENVDASAAQATALGGKILVPPSDVPDVGRFAVIADPSGAVIGIFQGESE